MKKILILLVCLLSVGDGWAEYVDNFVTDGIYYHVTSREEMTVEVVANHYDDNLYSGKIIIPGVVSTTDSGTYKVTSIADYAFSRCVGLTSVEIPNECTSFGSYAFKGCIGLTSVKIPDGCSIDSYAFEGCTGLTSIIIPDNAFYIGTGAFMNCTGLASVFISDTVMESFLYNAFSGCTGLKEFVASDNCTKYSTVDGVLFNKNKTNLLGYPYAKSGSYIIPNSVKYIVSHAFSHCSDLYSITIPNNVISIPDYAFSNCSKLSTAIVSGSVNSIGKFAFLSCTALSSVSIDNGLKSIGESAFSECISLNSISIPNSVSSIGKALFSGCINLHKLSLPFIGSSLDKPLDSSRSLGYLFMSKTFKYPAQEDKIEGYIAVIYGYTGQFSNRHAYYIPTSLKEVSVTNQVQLSDGSDNHSIFPGVFGGCTKLETINLPLATTIGKYAFHVCSNLTSLSLPMAKSINNSSELTFPSSLIFLNIGNLKNLGRELLSNLSKLEELTIPFVGTGVKETATGVQGLFGDLFSTYSNSGMKAVTQYYQDSRSKTYYLPANLRKVTVTEECEEIQYGAFYGCSTIKELTLPYTLYMMGEKALFGCAGLTDIYCKGAAPAAAHDNSFTGVRTTTCKLHIPYHTADLYKASDGWNKFFYMQEEAPLTVNVTKNILNAGIILGITEYQQGALAELSARANSGYHFKYWMDSDVIVSEEESYAFVVNDDKKLMAVFVPVLNDNSLVITAESNAVNFTWETVDDAEGYVLTIYSDAEMTKEIASYTFDMQGELVTRAGTSFFYRAADLKPESAYSYSLTANDKYNNVLSQQIGTFSTLATGIDNTSGDMDIRLNVGRQSVQVENADGKTIVIYDLQGICRAIIHKAENMESIQLQHSGIYLVRIGTFSQKIIVK